MLERASVLQLIVFVDLLTHVVEKRVLDCFPGSDPQSMVNLEHASKEVEQRVSNLLGLFRL